MEGRVRLIPTDRWRRGNLLSRESVRRRPECRSGRRRFESVESAKAFLDNPELKTKMGKAGVIGALRIEFYEEVDVR